MMMVVRPTHLFLVITLVATISKAAADEMYVEAVSTLATATTGSVPATTATIDPASVKTDVARRRRAPIPAPPPAVEQVAVPAVPPAVEQVAVPTVPPAVEQVAVPAVPPEPDNGPPPGASTASAKESTPEASEKAVAKPDDGAEERDKNPFALPGGIRLSGMFDAVYERNRRSGDLDGGRNDFRSYHHFLFISRQGDDVPVGFNAELLGLYFYELTSRLTGKGSRFRVSAHAGKILVPFGPDPLFHKSYGGQTGADQRLLPVVWSSIGGGMRFGFSWRGLTVSDEVYAVQGFDLPARDQGLVMQRDLIAYDGARIAAGDRLSISAGPFTLWYSFYWNQMRFGRQLIMQAVDLSLWRPCLPVLNRLALGVGAVRAHISKDENYGQPDAVAGAGAYYHFADYVWLRAYLFDWLYLQARSGLLTLNNHDGLYYDPKRADASDSSHHNVALVADYAGAQVSLAYFWNFEKVDERPDDMFRLTVSYAF
jgi:hypothetical protein